ncbi:SDR family oxidoreductase [Brevundimonas balnearis]|uniref:SDR family oxidoreductase n=1 Tax=Brevundimonas balnearis TaxID=1572858 RepID=A0ABV6QZM1_9CAUL
MTQNSNAPLAGKRALVTGGSRGIGAAIARRLAADGADVAITYVSSPDKAHAVVDEIVAAGRKAVAIAADSGDVRAVERSVAEAASTLGGLDIIVANAGVAIFAPVDQATIEDYERTFDINVKGVFAAAKGAAAHLPDGGRFIVIGSVNADRMPIVGGSLYGASKAAVQGMVRGLARDFGPRGITANVVQPGPVDTDMNPADGPIAEMLTPFLAIPTYAEGKDIAGLVAWLSGPEARYVTGAALTLDQGFLA